MFSRITKLFVLLIATALAQWDRRNEENSGFSLWENQGNQLNQNNRQSENQQQGSISWNNEEDNSDFQRPWNRPGNQNRPGFNQNRSETNQNRPGSNQNRPGTNQNRPGSNQNRPSGGNQNRPGTNQNRPWDRSTTSTTIRSTTRRTQRTTRSTTTSGSSTTSRGSSTTSDYSTTASPAFTSCMTMCRTTPEYNPVCGSDARTYNNEQRLNCAINCGLDINLAFRGACEPA